MTEDVGTDLARALEAIPQRRWDALGKRRIFFAHQSVGGNVVDGLSRVLAARPWIGLRVVKSSHPRSVEGGALVHDTPGVNGHPLSKTDGFIESLSHTEGEPFEIALQKYCFADFSRETDPGAVFTEYSARIAQLRRTWPALHVVHVTTPLLVARRSPSVVARDILRRLSGRTTVRERLSRVRQYNALLRAHCTTSNELFDLAAVESGRLGTPDMVARDDEALSPAFASADGAHLNGLGECVAATQLLLFLVALPSSASES